MNDDIEKALALLTSAGYRIFPPKKAKLKNPRQRPLEGKRDEVGRRVLAGEKAAALGREYGASTDTILACGEEVLRNTPGYDTHEHIQILCVPGSGKLKSMREMYRRLTVQL